jgi:hypothetical protein
VADIKATPTITVPLIKGPFCGRRNPDSGRQCRRADGHTGRHAFIWRHIQPGRVREVWT